MGISMTMLLVILTIGVSLAAWQVPKIMQRLVFYPPAVERGQVDRLVTHGFVHSNTMHLLFNMLTLWSFGRVIEPFMVQYIGRLGFVLFYLAALVVAILPSFFKERRNSRYVSLGASGAVMAVVFSYILLSPWTTIWFFVLPLPAIVFALLYVVYGLWANDNGHGHVNHLAHLVGGVFGVVAMVLMEPSVVPHFFAALMHPKFLGFGG